MVEKKPATKNVHILWNPNKNFLGHWDIPKGGDLILTIEKISWEDVKNPVTGSTESKRVVRFTEDIKPLICNEENANAIFKVCDTEMIEDYAGKNFKIGLHTISGRWFGEDRDAVRVRDESPKAKIKEKLTEDHPKWERAKKSVQNGETDLDGIRKYFEISGVDFVKLNK